MLYRRSIPLWASIGPRRSLTHRRDEPTNTSKQLRSEDRRLFLRLPLRNCSYRTVAAVYDRRYLEIGHLCVAWSKNSPPRLGGEPRAIHSSLESERRGGRSTSRSHLIDAREANRIKKGGLRQHLQGGFATLIDHP